MAQELDPERTVRLLRAKAADLENYVKPRLRGNATELDWLIADVSLIATLLADHIERVEGQTNEWPPSRAWLKSALEGGEITQEQHDAFMAGFQEGRPDPESPR